VRVPNRGLVAEAFDRVEGAGDGRRRVRLAGAFFDDRGDEGNGHGVEPPGVEAEAAVKQRWVVDVAVVGTVNGEQRDGLLSGGERDGVDHRRGGEREGIRRRDLSTAETFAEPVGAVLGCSALFSASCANALAMIWAVSCRGRDSSSWPNF
jgi:hypothetical protein